MAQVLALTDDAQQRLDSLLEGQRATVDLVWRPLPEAWYLTLTVGQTRILTGRQLTPWRRVLGYPVAGFDGDFVVVPAVGEDETDLGRNAWTRTHAVWYLTGPEVEAARQAGGGAFR